MLEVPQRPAAGYDGHGLEVVEGGGDPVAHSSVHASHGSSPARSPRLSETTMLRKKTRTAAEHPRPVQRQEREVEPDDEEPEVPATELLAQQAPGALGNQ
jgi:hypothetical protein